MNRVITVIAALFFSFYSLFSQNLEYGLYQLEDSPKYTSDLKEDKNAPLLELKNKYVIEYAFNNNQELFEYELVHKRRRLLTDNSIESNNKVYIPLGYGSELVRYEARVITKKGKVIKLGADAIKEGVDEESNYKFKYFAFEGVEIGSEIEFYYLIKKTPRLEGKRKVIQTKTDSYDVSFELIAPSHFEFVFKTFNGLPEKLQRDSTLEDKNKWVLEFDKVEAFKNQAFAFEESNKQYLLYKIDAFTNTNRKNLVSYEQESNNQYQRIFAAKDKSEKKAIAKIAKGISLDKTSTETKIRSIENYIKKNYGYAQGATIEDLTSCYTQKIYDDYWGAHLMSLLLTNEGIKHELVITSDRTSLPFDAEFEMYAMLQQYLFYFPEIDKYMDPVNPLLRLGYVLPQFMNTHGLFIKGVNIGKESFGVGEIKAIKELDSKSTTSNIYVNVEIDDEVEEPKYFIKSEAFGYYAMGTQPYYDYIKDESKKELLSKSVLQYIDNEGEIVNLKIENEGANNLGSKPFIVSGELETDKFFERAGNKYLFKLGELIGPQAEMYQEEERVLPVQNDHNRTYYREITFNIPDGYKITNLEDININETDKVGEKITMAFISSFTQEGNKIKVIVNEYYDQLDFPKEKFSDFQRVINAAANFNKVVLILVEEE